MIYRELFLTGGILIALALPAEAQDRWTGAYFGLSIDHSETTSEVSGSKVHSLSNSGSDFGIYAGYGIRGWGNFVWTPEITLSSLDTLGTASDAALGQTDFDGSFLIAPRVRAGYATPRAYYYGVLGLGFTDAGLRPAGSTDTDITVSLGLGLGAEVALDEQWSTRIEAMHYIWEGADDVFNGAQRNVDTDATILSLGLTRRF